LTLPRARRTDPPAVDEVVAGLWAIRLALDNPLLRHVYVYALELDGGGIVLVDAGWDGDDVFGQLADGLAVAGLAFSDVRGIAVTHGHPDHYGLVGRLREAVDPWVAAHRLEAGVIETRRAGLRRLTEQMAGWLRGQGVPEDEIVRSLQPRPYIREFVAVDAPTRLLDDGSGLDVPGWDLVTIPTPGHTAGHVSFHERRCGVVLLGDHLLAGAPTSIPLLPQSGPDPLGSYLEALARVEALGDIPGLAGHGARVGSVGARAREAISHHEEQLERTLACVGGLDTVWAIARRFPFTRPWDGMEGFVRRAAINEVHARLVLLEHRGLVRREGETPQRWAVS
jgi:glyoxylase-like metal-dependent hydrolase (beta-lactamase superfamily II)